MDMVPWKPFKRELEPFRKEMEKLWNRFFGESPLERSMGDEWLPSADVTETDEHVVIKAELPGLEAKDIDVSISGDMLTIKGEKKKEEEKKGEHYHFSERYYGSFERSFRLPSTVQVDKVEAVFEKGVLRVTLPKTEEARKKEIKIKVK